MKSLPERHIDRAKRKGANAAEAGADRTGQDVVGSVAAKVAEATEALETLSPEDRDEVERRLRNEMQPSDGFISTDPASIPHAGVGIVNPLVATAEPQSGNGAGNLSAGDIAALGREGAAEAAQAAEAAAPAAGWGAPAKDETVDADGKALTKADLKAILDARTPPVAYETDANLERLQELVKGAPKAT